MSSATLLNLEPVDRILFRVSEGLRPLSDRRSVKTLILTSDTSLLYV